MQYALKLDPFVVHADGTTESVAPADSSNGLSGPFLHDEPFQTVEEAIRRGFQSFRGCLEHLNSFKKCSGADILVCLSGEKAAVAVVTIMRGWLICPSCGECYPHNPKAFNPVHLKGEEVEEDVIMYDRAKRKLVVAPTVRTVASLHCTNCARSVPIAELCVDVDMAAYGPLGTRYMSMRRTGK